jgi:hypothetical protein
MIPSPLVAPLWGRASSEIESGARCLEFRGHHSERQWNTLKIRPGFVPGARNRPG